MITTQMITTKDGRSLTITDWLKEQVACEVGRRMAMVICPKCNTILEKVPGIGPVCPNKNCEVADGSLAYFEDKILNTLKVEDKITDNEDFKKDKLGVKKKIIRCVSLNCGNTSDEVKFVGQMCEPCYKYMTTGVKIYSYTANKKCIVKGCNNKSDQGKFIGDLCGPCYEYITTGQKNNSRAYLNAVECKHLDVIDMAWPLGGISRLCKDCLKVKFINEIEITGWLNRSYEKISDWYMAAAEQQKFIDNSKEGL